MLLCSILARIFNGEYAKEKIIFDDGTGSVKIQKMLSAKHLIEAGFIISLWMPRFVKMMAFGLSIEEKIIQKICHDEDNDGGDRRP